MIQGKVTISTANINDATVLTQLSTETFYETFGRYNKKEDMDKYVEEEMNIVKLTEELRDKNCLFFLAHHNDKAIGYAKVAMSKKPPGINNHKALEIARIYVLREYYNQKIGAALMLHCLDYAINNQCTAIWLGVWEHNDKAIHFYKRWGFKVFGTHIFRLGNDDQTDLLMEKEL